MNVTRCAQIISYVSAAGHRKQGSGVCCQKLRNAACTRSHRHPDNFENDEDEDGEVTPSPPFICWSSCETLLVMMMKPLTSQKTPSAKFSTPFMRKKRQGLFEHLQNDADVSASQTEVLIKAISMTEFAPDNSAKGMVKSKNCNEN